jgi:hypothetical protein
MGKTIKSMLIYLFILTLSEIAHPALADNPASHSSKNEMDRFVSSLMKVIAETYFHYEKKPLIRVAIFDLEDLQDNISVGSRHISNRFRMAFGSNPQFELVGVHSVQEKFKVNGRAFDQNARLRNLIVNELQSDVYIFGQVTYREMSEVICQFGLYDRKGEPILMDSHLELSVQTRLTPSGYQFFTRILADVGQMGQTGDEEFGMAEVVFLTQPVCDETNPWWEVKDGLIYRKSDAVSFTPEFGYGAVMKGHIKTYEEFMGTGHAVAAFGLMIHISGKEPFGLESYVLPKESNYYYLLDEEGTQYRFEYLWHNPGRGVIPGPHVGVGWKFFVAEEDWPIKMPTGTHEGMAYLEPVSQKLFGASTRKPDYYKRFQFVVKPGLNVYVINYAHHADKPKIFVKRLEFSKGQNDTAPRTIKEIMVSKTLYGSD